MGGDRPVVAACELRGRGEECRGRPELALLDGQLHDLPLHIAGLGAGWGSCEETEDPLEGIVEDDNVIDDLGGIQAPGTAYTITGDGVEAGDYVLLCFIPNSEGTPHFSLGMLAGFTVGDGDTSDVPEPDVTYTVNDDSLEGPTELDAGDTSFEIVNDSSTNREINLLKIAEGNTIEDVFAFFESAEEGPPDFASAPLDFFAFVFDGASDRTITVDLTEGQWAIQTPDPEQPFEGAPTEDPHAILLTVS